MCGVGGEGEERGLVISSEDAFVLANPVEVCGEGGITGDGELARVGCVAVVPAEESVVFVGYGGECDGVAVEVGAAACDATAESLVGLYGDKEGFPVGEECGERGVLGDEDGAWVVGVAVVPPEEVVARSGSGVDGLVDMFGQFAVGVCRALGAVGRNGVHHGIVYHGLYGTVEV